AADFGFSDTSDTPADNFLGVVITTPPLAGNLRLNGVAVNASQLVLRSDIDTGKLVYTAPSSQPSQTPTIAFQVKDAGGTAGGGLDLDPSPSTLALNISVQHHAPQGADAAVTGSEDQAYSFSVADFGFSDSLDGDNLLAVRITALPTVGSLTNGGLPV